jgi:hypothetical protein
VAARKWKCSIHQKKNFDCVRTRLARYHHNYSKIRHVSVARLPVVDAQLRRHNSESVCCERLAVLPAECGEYRIDGAIF